MTRTKTRHTLPATPTLRCTIYTRKSTDEGLDQAFNSRDAQRESGEAYIASQKQLENHGTAHRMANENAVLREIDQLGVQGVQPGNRVWLPRSRHERRAYPVILSELPSEKCRKLLAAEFWIVDRTASTVNEHQFPH